MYLHIGQNTVIENRTVVGIFDLDAVTVTENARKFLSDAEKNGQVEYVSLYDLPKSFIVCIEDGKQKIYISPLNAQTLTKRVI